MKSLGKTILFGFLLWLTVFIGAMIVYVTKDSNPPFFETLIAIILTMATVFFGRWFFKSEELTLKRCVTVGLIWALVNIAIDIPLFSFGPMKKTFYEYVTDIGLTYLIIPIILSVFAFRRQTAEKAQ